MSTVYGDWEISADRATAVRRKLLESGVPPRQVIKVAGFGDTVPMPDHDTTDEINRRVTVLLNLPPQRQESLKPKESIQCQTLLFPCARRFSPARTTVSRRCPSSPRRSPPARRFRAPMGKA